MGLVIVAAEPQRQENYQFASEIANRIIYFPDQSIASVYKRFKRLTHRSYYTPENSILGMPAEACINLLRYQETFVLDEKLWKDEKTSALLDSEKLEDTKIKKMARSGIPDRNKALIYSRILKFNRLPEYERSFQAGLSRAHGDCIPEDPIPPLFGGKPHLHSVALATPGIFILEHTLCILAHDFPQVEYCPFIPSMTALLCHHMQNPDDVLGSMVVILNSCMKSASPEKEPEEKWTFFPTDKKEIVRMAKAFSYLLSRYSSKVHKHVEDLSPSGQEMVWLEWIANLFIHQLPQPILWRMLDVFLIEGYKTLFRFGIALIQYHKKAILTTTSLQELEKVFNPSNIPEKDYNELIKSAWSVNFARSDLSRPKSFSSKFLSDELLASFQQFRVAPKNKNESSILQDHHWIAIWSWIPFAKRHCVVDLKFSTEMHGYNLSTMVSETSGVKPMLLVIKTTNGSVFGAFLSESWSEGEEKSKFFGTGETFLFVLEPFAKMYPWVHREIDPVSPNGSPLSPMIREYAADSSMFIMNNDNEIAIGGGGTEYGIWLDKQLSNGRTGTCQTFMNEPLTGTKSKTFDCAIVEIFGFE